MRDVATQPLSDLGQLPDLGDLCLALLALQLLDGALEETLVGREARVLRDAIVVLASQETGGERRPNGGAVLELVEEGSVFDFESLAMEGVVLRLLGDAGGWSVQGRKTRENDRMYGLDSRSNEVVLLGNLSGLHDLRSRPFTRAPIVGQVEVADALSETLDNLLHRRAHVRAMGKDNVNIVELQALERGLEAFADVLAGQTTGVRLLAA